MTVIDMQSFMAPELDHCDTNNPAEFGKKVDVWGAGIAMLRVASLQNPSKEEIEQCINNDLALYSDGLREIMKGVLQSEPNERWNPNQICEHPNLSNLVRQLQ